MDETGAGVGRLGSQTQNSDNPRGQKSRRQLVQWVTPSRRMRNKGSHADDEHTQDLFDDNFGSGGAQSSGYARLPEGGGLASLEMTLQLPVQEDEAEMTQYGVGPEADQMIEAMKFKAKPEHIKALKLEAMELFKNAKSLFRTEDEVEKKLSIKNAWFGSVPKSTPKFGVGFETPVLSQAFFGDGGRDWSYTDPVSGIHITVHKHEAATIRMVKEAVHNMKHSFAATSDHLVATKHVEEMRRLTSFDRFKSTCNSLIQKPKPFGARGPDLGESAALWSGETHEAGKKIITLYKSTIDRAFKEAEKLKAGELAIKKEKTRVAKTLVETSPEEFVEMRIQERILKHMGKGKGKGKGGKTTQLSHYDLADLMEDSDYKKLKPEDKVKAIESYLEVKVAAPKKQTNGFAPGGTGGWTQHDGGKGSKGSKGKGKGKESKGKGKDKGKQDPGKANGKSAKGKGKHKGESWEPKGKGKGGKDKSGGKKKGGKGHK